MANVASKYKSELQLVIRALTAAALSLLIAEVLASPQSYWAVITALIIVQGSLGGTLTAGLDRLVGTLAGAVLGAAAALAGEFWDAPEVVLLLLVVPPVALLAAIRSSFRMAPMAVQPGRKQLVRHRPENDWEGLVGANLLCRHCKATSSSLTGLQFSTASSVSCSEPVSMASMATSFKRRKSCEVMPPVTCRIRLRPRAVKMLGSRSGRLRRMARISC
ncbi:Fusaric acid resistance protein-like [Rhizobiales bacterium GAS113]|nr:Fusaric acid resistance protein-like [Rhizobiales bacterium GAS113]